LIVDWVDPEEMLGGGGVFEVADLENIRENNRP